MKGTPGKTSLRRMLGIVVGGALGLLVESLLVLVFGVTILYFVVFTLGLVVIVPIWIGIAWGIKWARKLPREPSWQVVVLLAAALWPAAVGGPFAIRIVQLRSAAWHDVPQYPRARNVSMTAELGDGENTSNYVRMKFTTKDAPAEVIEFYKNELSRRGWKPGPPHFIEWRMDGTPLWFTRSVPWSGFGGILLGMESSLHIKFGPASNQRGARFEIIYGLHWDHGKTRSKSSDMWRRAGGRPDPSRAMGQTARNVPENTVSAPNAVGINQMP